MSAKRFVNVGGTKDTHTNGMTFSPRHNISTAKVKARRAERHGSKLMLREVEQGEARVVGREHGDVVFSKATVSTRGVTGYTNLSSYDGRLYLE
jgi:hypothetical protein